MGELKSDLIESTAKAVDEAIDDAMTRTKACEEFLNSHRGDIKEPPRSALAPGQLPPAPSENRDLLVKLLVRMNDSKISQDKVKREGVPAKERQVKKCHA